MSRRSPQNVLFQGLIQHRRDDQRNDGIGQHIGAVIDQRIGGRTGEGPLHELRGSQNFGAGRWDRIRQGVRACLIQTEAFNLIMCIGILLLRHPIVRMFLSDPTKEIYHYSDMYLTIVAPFYFVLGLLAVYRTSIQSMQNGKAPFAACMIELVMRIAATVGLSGIIGYTSVCIASPMAWIGACALLIPVYYKMMKGNCAALL